MDGKKPWLTDKPDYVRDGDVSTRICAGLILIQSQNRTTACVYHER